MSKIVVEKLPPPSFYPLGISVQSKKHKEPKQKGTKQKEPKQKGPKQKEPKQKEPKQK